MKIFILLLSCVIYEIATLDFLNQRFFEVIPDRVDILKETPEIVIWRLKVRKVNKTRSLVGYIVTNVPLGNDVKIEVKMLKKQGGQYRYLPYSVPAAPYCDALANDVYAYPDIAKNSDFPENIKENCPIPPGNYTFYGVTFELKHVPKVTLPSGEYAAEANCYNDAGEQFASYRIFAYINNV